jgi:protein phosphatase
MCAEKALHYASSTGVVVFLWKNLLTVAHVGDSKACIARLDGNEVHPEWLTVDHKPNMPNELRRIEASGGSLAWLHGNKPYIRGGDFFKRQALGEHPKQLNYSRAFGGKDLKMFGLSAEPDISHFQVATEDRLVLIASDGLWDVLNPRVACEIAFRAKAQGRSASADIVAATIREMPICGVRDNITVVAIFLNDTNTTDTGAEAVASVDSALN